MLLLLQYKYDVSLPLVGGFYEIVEATRETLRRSHGHARVVGYGHMADNNIHLNVCIPGHQVYDEKLQDVIDASVYNFTVKMKGSISAEHGIGQLKLEKLRHSKAKEVIRLMKTLKSTMDARGILNPGKVLPMD